MNTWLLVGIGGFFGAIGRYFIGNWSKKKFKKDFPIGTLAVNLIGSFFLGFLFAATYEKTYLFLGVGFLGAFTTFSTMNVEAVQLVLQKKSSLSIGYVLLTYFLGIVLAFVGFFIGDIF